MPTAIPASLPAIDEVEIVDLTGLDISAGTLVEDAADAFSVRVKGAKAQRIADLWRALVPGEQARCHIPPFGLRFHANCKIVAQASICWRCNNIHGESRGDRLLFEFDGEHATARELLAILENEVGHWAAE